MKTELWEKIETFDFDYPASEYGFSIRLANENFWTKDFTALAIAEYKKFMYLAATSDFMVSPSEIVDVVWHQHLVFSQSYNEFCHLLGKRIEHNPSTHNKTEFLKFQQAKERTYKLYEIHFGKNPESIWKYKDMYGSLNLDKAKYRLRTSIIVGILGLIALILPFYFIFKPIYLKINNPYFLMGFLSLTILVFITLELFNKARLKKISYEFAKDSFAFGLSPLESIYLKTLNLSNVINGVINELVEGGMVIINKDNTLEVVHVGQNRTIEQLQVLTTLKETGKVSYYSILRKLVNKPIFWNIANFGQAFRKYFYKSKKFHTLFYLNFSVLSFLLLIGATRLLSGILRAKPILDITLIVFILAALIIFYLNRLKNLFFKSTLPDLYRKHIIPERGVANDWQWIYFLLGASVLTASFIPVIKNEKSDSGSATGCGASTDSSCGSSCSSCGGCGGD